MAPTRQGGEGGPARLLSIDDLSDTAVRELLDRARALWSGVRPDRMADLVVGLMFLTPSLRTRVGFSVATARLGGIAVDVAESRWSSGMTSAESLADTIRTVAGMADLVVVRSPVPLDDQVISNSPVPVVNAGDGDHEHPTQALIDLLAIEEERGPVGDLRIGVCGDLTTRSVRSLLKLLDRLVPRQLVLCAPEGRQDHGVDLRAVGVAPQLEHRSELVVEGLDVVYLAGLPEGVGADRLGPEERGPFALTGDRLGGLAADAVILSPMPVIDEMDAVVRADPRLRMFGQSDRGVAVRMAVIERVLNSPMNDSPGGR